MILSNNKMDLRRLRVSIEVDGTIKTYEDLAISAQGEKRANPIENFCAVEIFNLNPLMRHYLLTETSPFNENRTRKTILIEAGRQNSSVAKVFIGDICSATPSAPPDIGLKIQARTGAFIKGNLIANFENDKQDLSKIAKKIANDINASLEFEANDKKIANYSFTGGALKQIQKLAEAGNVNAFLDDAILVVKNKDTPRSRYNKIISKETGMIGVPELTEHGVQVTCLYDNEIAIGGKIIIKSDLNQAINGEYEIYQLGFDLSSHDTPWYSKILAKRL